MLKLSTERLGMVQPSCGFQKSSPKLSSKLLHPLNYALTHVQTVFLLRMMVCSRDRRQGCA